MRHSIHIMFGQEMEDSLNRLTDYVYKYGEKDASSHYYPVLWQTERKDNAEQLFKLAELILGIAGIFDVPGAKPLKHIIHFIREIRHLYPEVSSCSLPQGEPYIQHFFHQIYQKHVTIEHPGDGAGMCIFLHLPLFDLEKWKYAKMIVEQIQQINFSFQIDLLGYTTDLSYLFLSDEENNEFPLHKKEYQQNAYTILQEALNLRNDNKLSHVVIMQNKNEKNLSLNLDHDSFTRLIGELTLVCLENYRYFFENTLDNNKNEIATFGLAVLNFDKYHFVNYLLSRAFLHQLEEEGVDQTEVDINMVTDFVNNLLKNDAHLIDNLRQEIFSLLKTERKSESEVILQLDKLIDEKFKQLTSHLLSFLEDVTLNIPQKQALMAGLLDQDDELFKNYVEIPQTATLTDFDKEALGYFMEANYQLGCKEESLLSEEEYAELKKYALDLRWTTVDAPLDEIKRIKANIKSQTILLKRKKDESEKLQQHLSQIQEREKVLTENGYCFQGRNYKLLHLEETPLQETYSSDNRPALRSVDLRSLFPPVKDQGSQGACTAFAFTSVYEYILKNEYQTDTDLSEAFVYWHARQQRGNTNEDTGCSLYDAVASLMKEGICKEMLCPYQADVTQPTITQVACEDAKTRLVIKAMNVKTHEKDLKAALSEGYPVIVSLLIFDSMTKIKGFIPYPEEDERKNEQSAHAMVLCGYDEDKRIFIVRNSWGEDFGEKGYAYIPFSYVCDPKLMRMACIITEISGGESVHSQGRTAANFDIHENQVQYAIASNLVKEITNQVRCEQHYLEKIQAEYELLKTQLEKKENRDRIYNGITLRLKYELNSLQQKIAGLTREHQIDLEYIRRTYQKKMVRCLPFLAGLVCLILLWFGYRSEFPATVQYMTGGILVFLTSMVLIRGFYFYYCGKQQEKQSCQNYQTSVHLIKDQINVRQKKLEALRIEVSLHGRVIDKLFTLKNQLGSQYNSIIILLQNLKTWYEEEKRKIEQLAGTKENTLFVSLLSDKQLDAYYRKVQQEKIVPQLFRFILGNNTWTEERLRQVKNDSIDKVIRDLLEKIDDFDISDLLRKYRQYPYLDHTPGKLSLMLAKLDKKSCLFVDKRFFIKANPERVKTAFVPIDTQEDVKTWNKIFSKSSAIPPSAVAMQTPYKVSLLQRANILISEKDKSWL